MGDSVLLPLLQVLSKRNEDGPLEIYANNVRMGATLSDFVIVLGAIRDRGANAPVVQDLVAARLSPMTTKVLLMNLQAAMLAYEEVLGEIRLPNSVTQDMETVRTTLVNAFAAQMTAPTHVGTATFGPLDGAASSS